MASVKYIDHPKFPASAPLNHPHVLNASTTDVSGIRLCDAITTFLYHLDARFPGTLDAFYDKKNKEVKVVRTSTQGKPGAQFELNLVIWRMHDTVLVGFSLLPSFQCTHLDKQAGTFTPDTRLNRLAWKAGTRSIWDAQGQWTTLFGARTALSWPPLEYAGPNHYKFSLVNMGDWSVDPKEEKEKNGMAAKLAEIIWVVRMWEEKAGAVFRVEVS